MDKHEVKGGMKEAGGAVKEATGKAVGNDRMEAEGAVDKAEGNTEKNYGKAKDAVKDAVK